MRNIVIDTETALILPGLAQPPVACLSWTERKEGELKAGILDQYEGAEFLIRCLERNDIRIIGHHIQYDTVGIANDLLLRDPERGEHLLRLLFAAYKNGRITDTLLRQKLYDLSRGLMHLRQAGYYGLAKLISKYFRVDLDKTTWRTGYGKLIDVPLDQWASGARKYAIDDSIWTLFLFEKQEEEFGFGSGQLCNDFEQSRAGFALQLMKAWGMRTEKERVTKVKERFTHAYNCFKDELISSKDENQRSILRPDGTQDMAFTKELVLSTYTLGEVPLTKKGLELQKAKKLTDRNKYIQTGAEVVKECSHPFLQNLSDFKATQKVLKTFIPVVERGTFEPICPNINTLVKNGRSSYGNPNLQNLPREGGIRECFIPRAGKIYINADYDTLEVRTFAQVLFDMGIGDTLLRAYNQDPDFDPHTRLAAQILGITYEQALLLRDSGDKTLKDTRQRAKVCNFGYPGGMGAVTFIEYAKAYKLILTVSEAENLKNFWKKSVPEVKKYFKWVARLTADDKKGVVAQLRSGRIRGGCGFTDLANTTWSGLAADGVKEAVANVAEACYVDRSNPLFGSRPVVVVHDELIVETEIGNEHAAGMELAKIMMWSMEIWTPNVPSRASPCAMRRWYKGAEPVFQNGILIPYEPSP